MNLEWWRERHSFHSGISSKWVGEMYTLWEGFVDAAEYHRVERRTTQSMHSLFRRPVCDPWATENVCRTMRDPHLVLSKEEKKIPKTKSSAQCVPREGDLPVYKFSTMLSIWNAYCRNFATSILADAAFPFDGRLWTSTSVDFTLLIDFFRAVDHFDDFVSEMDEFVVVGQYLQWNWNRCNLMMSNNIIQCASLQWKKIGFAVRYMISNEWVKSVVGFVQMVVTYLRLRSMWSRLERQKHDWTLIAFLMVFSVMFHE